MGHHCVPKPVGPAQPSLDYHPGLLLKVRSCDCSRPVTLAFWGFCGDPLERAGSSLSLDTWEKGERNVLR